MAMKMKDLEEFWAKMTRLWAYRGPRNVRITGIDPAEPEITELSKADNPPTTMEDLREIDEV